MDRILGCLDCEKWAYRLNSVWLVVPRNKHVCKFVFFFFNVCLNFLYYNINVMLCYIFFRKPQVMGKKRNGSNAQSEPFAKKLKEDFEKEYECVMSINYLWWQCMCV